MKKQLNDRQADCVLRGYDQLMSEIIALVEARRNLLEGCFEKLYVTAGGLMVQAISNAANGTLPISIELSVPLVSIAAFLSLAYFNNRLEEWKSINTKIGQQAMARAKIESDLEMKGVERLTAELSSAGAGKVAKQGFALIFGTIDILAIVSWLLTFSQYSLTVNFGKRFIWKQVSKLLQQFFDHLRQRNNCWHATLRPVRFRRSNHTPLGFAAQICKTSVLI